MNIFYKLGINADPSMVCNHLVQYLECEADKVKVETVITQFIGLSKELYPNYEYLFITLEKRPDIELPNISEGFDISWGGPEDYDWLINEDKSEYMGELV